LAWHVHCKVKGYDRTASVQKEPSK
jgi:hypothetical protein